MLKENLKSTMTHIRVIGRLAESWFMTLYASLVGKGLAGSTKSQVAVLACSAAVPLVMSYHLL